MSRYLTAALVALILLPACKDPDADARIAKLEATVEAQAGIIADLQAQLGKQPDSTGMVASLEQRVAGLETSLAQAKQRLDGVMATKVPHLIGNPGTAEEVDLGPFTDFNHYWNDAVGGFVSIVSAKIGWTNDDCTGTPMAINFGNGTEYMNSDHDTIIRVGAPDTMLIPRSEGDPDSSGFSCDAHPTVIHGYGAPITDTGVRVAAKLATRLSVRLK